MNETLYKIIYWFICADGCAMALLVLIVEIKWLNNLPDEEDPGGI